MWLVYTVIGCQNAKLYSWLMTLLSIVCATRSNWTLLIGIWTENIALVNMDLHKYGYYVAQFVNCLWWTLCWTTLWKISMDNKLYEIDLESTWDLELSVQYSKELGTIQLITLYNHIKVLNCWICCEILVDFNLPKSGRFPYNNIYFPFYNKRTGKWRQTEKVVILSFLICRYLWASSTINNYLQGICT